MEIDEVVARVVRRYWPLLLIMTLLPVPLVGVVLDGRPPAHTAKTRLQASSKATDAAPGDAGVSIVVSQVKAFATSRNLLDEVLRTQGLNRDPAKLATRIQVTGLGTSTIVEMAVTDTAPDSARRLADAIAAAVVVEINNSNLGALNAQLDKLDKQIKSLNRQMLSATRRVTSNPTSVSAANERDRVAGELADLRADRGDLRNQLAQAGQASVVQPAVLAPQQNLVLVLSVIAALVGLVLGILIAVVAEMLHPTIPGAERVARRLGVPLLGNADGGPAQLADLGRRIRLAAKREGVTRVTLVGTGGRPLPADLVSKVAAAVYGDTTSVVPADRVPAGTGSPDTDDSGSRDDRSGDDDDHSTHNGHAGHDTHDGTDGDGGDGIGRLDHDAAAGADDSGPGRSISGPSTAGTSVVRSSAALMTREARRISDAAKAGSPAAAAVRAQCHVHAFEDFDPGSDDPVGVVAVAGRMTRLSGLRSVHDLVTATGWPLLGVMATSRKIKG